jgi:hypothetical protein
MKKTDLSTTERFLRLFTEVRPGEGPIAVIMFANVFLILLAYYFIKPMREGWIAVSDIQGLSKMEVKAYSSFAQSLLLLFVVGWYARLADRLDRATLFTRATLFCISNMVVFWGCSRISSSRRCRSRGSCTTYGSACSVFSWWRSSGLFALMYTPRSVARACCPSSLSARPRVPQPDLG